MIEVFSGAKLAFSLFLTKENARKSTNFVNFRLLFVEE